MIDAPPVRFQINNATILKRKEPLITFDLSVSIQNDNFPDYPFVFCVRNCFAKTYKKHETRDNPNGWKWCGPLQNKSFQKWANYEVSQSFHDAVLGILAVAPHGKSGVPILRQAEAHTQEYLDSKWRVPDEDEVIGGILLK